MVIEGKRSRPRSSVRTTGLAALLIGVSGWAALTGLPVFQPTSGPEFSGTIREGRYVLTEDVRRFGALSRPTTELSISYRDGRTVTIYDTQDPFPNGRGMPTAEKIRFTWPNGDSYRYTATPLADGLYQHLLAEIARDQKRRTPKLVSTEF